ncbi:MAG: hypothetical protein ABI240_13035 [Sphingomonas sp.]
MNSLIASLAVRRSRRHRSIKAVFASWESLTSIVSLFLGGVMEAIGNSPDISPLPYRIAANSATRITLRIATDETGSPVGLQG